MVEMEFDTFLERYIPENGQPLPTTPAPAMSKEKLMGLEGDVCNELVRRRLRMYVDASSDDLDHAVQGGAGPVPAQQYCGEARCKDDT